MIRAVSIAVALSVSAPGAGQLPSPLPEVDADVVSDQRT